MSDVYTRMALSRAHTSSKTPPVLIRRFQPPKHASFFSSRSIRYSGKLTIMLIQTSRLTMVKKERKHCQRL